MKKVILSTLSLAVLVFGVGSCKKEQPNSIGSVVVVPNSYNIKIIPNPHPATDYMPNEEDRDDEKIRRQLYEIALEIRPLFTDNSFNELIFNEAKQHDNSCIKLENFLNVAQSHSNDKKKNVASEIQQKLPSLDLTHTPVGEMRNGDLDTYIPAIFVVNLDVADMSKAPIISGGTCVNANQHPDMLAYEDYIVAWLINGENDYTELLINEEMAMNTDHPIFIIDNAEDFISTRQKQVFQIESADAMSTKNQETAWYSTYEHMIWNRFDNTNNSEFTITAAQIDNMGVVKLVVRDGIYYQEWKEINKIHKNDLGKTINKWVEFTINKVTPFDFNFIFWNTYERDWYASEKGLGQGTRNGKTVYLYGRRSNSSDIYGYRTQDVDNNPLHISNIYWNWARWYNENSATDFNSRLRFWRIQP